MMPSHSSILYNLNIILYSMGVLLIFDQNNFLRSNYKILLLCCRIRIRIRLLLQGLGRMGGLVNGLARLRLCLGRFSFGWSCVFMSLLLIANIRLYIPRSG